MARVRMWPAKLPRQVREDPHRRAEVIVFDLLEQQLGSGWVVFYSRPWLGLSPYGEEKDGECDFVVMHPHHGYITLEVKGGGISHDPKTGKWISTDRHSLRHNIKNPLGQAVAAKHQLLDKVQKITGWHGRFIRIRHGVVFPDTVTPPGDLGADGPREIFCCRDELPRIGEWIQQRLTGGNVSDLGADGIRNFEELLAKPFLLRVPLGHYLDDDDQAIAALTPQQYYILDAVGHLQRVAAGGGAGTGKTIVAMEDATRLAGQGLRTAFICRSPQLAAHVRSRLAKAEPRVAVFSLSEFCADACRQAGMMCPADIEKQIEAMLVAISATPSLRLDALIIDEAQDFRTHWWVALDELLADTQTSRLHAFFDTNQSVYGDLSGELASFRIVPIHLTRNLRNTKLIHEAASRFYRGIPVSADGPDGMDVDWQEASDSQVATKAVENARRLIVNERVTPEDIVILCASASVRAAVRNRADFPEGVDVEEIQDFKGLERRVVIIAASRELADQSELAYVALSRARAHTLVVGETPIISWLKGGV